MSGPTAVWCDGELVDPDQPLVTALDHGLMLGDGLFETFRALDGRPLLLDRHLARLRTGAATIGLPPLPGDAELAAAVDAVLGATRLDRARVRVTATSGAGPLGPARGPGPPRVLVAAGPLPHLAPTVAVATVPWRRNERSPLAGVKSTSYAEQLALLRAAADAGADEVVAADTTGRVSEAATANVFYVLDGELRTPSLATGCLPGVMRALVLERTGAVELDGPLDDLARATEVFLTSSLRAVHPVATLDGRPLPAPGPTTREAAAAVAEALSPGAGGPRRRR